MLKAHIYIATDSISLKNTKKHFGYVLECSIAGKIETREGFGEITGTYNQAVLTALAQALGRFTQTCEIHVHTENKYVLNMIKHNLPTWAGNGFLSSKGDPVANQGEWIQLWSLMKKQLIITEPGKHPYTEWLQTEMRGK